MYHDDDKLNFINKYANDKNMQNDIKAMDKGYFKIKKTVTLDDDRLKKVNIELYCSGDTGSYIRNAITGYRLPFFVGSKDEDLFFKTGISSGETRNAGSFFYDSPEQFEKHQYITLPLRIKETWNQKRLAHQKNNS